MPRSTSADEIAVVDSGRLLRFTFEDLIAYHGPGSPGGVAHAFKVMQRAWPLLAADAAPERRAITVRTAFGGPGARDGFELVTRAVTGDRYVLDSSLARPERGRAMERFVFRLEHAGAAVTLAVRPGFVADELHRPRPHRGPHAGAGGPARRAQARDGRPGHGRAGGRGLRRDVGSYVDRPSASRT